MATKKKKESPAPTKVSSRLREKQNKEIDAASQSTAREKVGASQFEKDEARDHVQAATPSLPLVLEAILENSEEEYTQASDTSIESVDMDNDTMMKADSAPQNDDLDLTLEGNPIVPILEENSMEHVVIEEEYVLDPSVKKILDMEAAEAKQLSKQIEVAKVDETNGVIVPVVNLAAASPASQVVVSNQPVASNQATAEPSQAAALIPTSKGAVLGANKWGNGSKPSFVSLFKDNREPDKGMKLRYIEPKGDIIDLTSRVLPSMVDIWGHCLVGYFDGGYPGYKNLQTIVQKWAVPCRFRSHDKGWVIFKFQNDKDRAKVLMEGPYTLFGKRFPLKLLSDDFSMSDEEFLKVPIWVQFPHLPMRIWNEDIISEVASKVGLPLTTDRVTLEKARSNFARVLIEIDASKPPPLELKIKLPNGKLHTQFVRYETFPNYCFHCKKFGHHAFTCSIIASIEKKVKEDAIKKSLGINIEEGAAEGAISEAKTVAESSSVAAKTVSKEQAMEEENDLFITKRDHPFFKKFRFFKWGKKKPIRGEGGTSDFKDGEDVLIRKVQKFHDTYQDEVIVQMETDEVLMPSINVTHKKHVDKDATIIKMDHHLKIVKEDQPGMLFTKECLEDLPGITTRDKDYTFDSSFMRAVFRHYLCRFYEEGCPRGKASLVKRPSMKDFNKVRVVNDIRDAYRDDVIVKLELDKDNLPLIHLLHSGEVNDQMVRLDNYLRVTQDELTEGLTFTTKCLEAIPGVFDTEYGYEFNSWFIEYPYTLLYLTRYKARAKPSPIVGKNEVRPRHQGKKGGRRNNNKRS
ncbi:unnamed protein product [Cuscuta epithymum]|uniref:DUF4283 domain-containing protein n=1 Tax=Cuscuta epithymum TaxID=186058 RepID=A0AAV0FJ70_9ASTE|nr:unnamed protein product [Cuscuta epithymum]